MTSSIREQMTKTTPWTEWATPVTWSDRELPPPELPPFDDRARARMFEHARLESRAEYNQKRCADRKDGVLCVRRLLSREPSDAIAELERRSRETSRHDSKFCDCPADPALLAQFGAPALVPILRYLARSAHWDQSLASEVLDEVDSPWALPLVLPLVLGAPSFETHNPADRHKRNRARRWLRRAARSVPIVALIREIATGIAPRAFEELVPEAVNRDGIDTHPTLVHCARVALALLEGESVPPLLLPRGQTPEVKYWPAELGLGGPLSEAERTTLVGWFDRMEWCLPRNPAILLAESLDAAERRTIAEALRVSWLGTVDPADWVLPAALVFGGPALAESLADPKGWPKDTFGARRDWNRMSFLRWIGQVAAAASEEDRTRYLNILGEVALDATKARLMSRLGALRGLEECAAVLNEPRDTFDERYVPSYGFDGRGQIALPYGAREVSLSLDTSFELVVDDGSKKKKSLPTKKKTDDPAAIDLAKATFAALKKRLKIATDGTTARAEQWIRTGQRWSRADFDAVIAHPLLGAAARGLVWGAFAGERLVQTFRVAEDRTFADEHDGPFSLGDEEVGALHVAELGAEARAKWQVIFADYEILQLTSQLGTELVTLPLAPGDPTSLAVPAFVSDWRVKDVEKPALWRTVRWMLLDDDRATLTKLPSEKTLWELDVRGWPVKIEGTDEALVARVRRHGDWRCHWLPWTDVPPVVGQIVLADLVAYAARLER